jgi:hypothetical protein
VYGFFEAQRRYPAVVNANEEEEEREERTRFYGSVEGDDSKSVGGEKGAAAGAGAGAGEGGGRGLHSFPFRST